jgi:hypothetical protein
MDRWRFDDPPNVAVFIDRKILSEGKWVARVLHDMDDGAWQFHTNERKELRTEDAAVVSLREMIELDPTLSELADLPLGWGAWRQSKTSPWERAKSTGE